MNRTRRQNNGSSTETLGLVSIESLERSASFEEGFGWQILPPSLPKEASEQHRILICRKRIKKERRRQGKALTTRTRSACVFLFIRSLIPSSHTRLLQRAGTVALFFFLLSNQLDISHGVACCTAGRIRLGVWSR